MALFNLHHHVCNVTFGMSLHEHQIDGILKMVLVNKMKNYLENDEFLGDSKTTHDLLSSGLHVDSSLHCKMKNIQYILPTWDR